MMCYLRLLTLLPVNLPRLVGFDFSIVSKIQPKVKDERSELRSILYFGLTQTLKGLMAKLALTHEKTSALKGWGLRDGKAVMYV